jgi:TRAP-type C4-dicarboxylate transport system substrate-binding protein
MRDVERLTAGRAQVKVYFGGIAGDESEELQRIKRGQLDGAISGAPACREVMPSFKLFELPGLFQEAGEAEFVIRRLAPDLTKEAERAGFVFLAATPLGAFVFFTRNPVASMAELRRTRLWVWDQEPTLVSLLRAMGLTPAPAPIGKAAREFDAGNSDGFLAIPTATLAFQWGIRAHQLIDLRLAYLFGCLILTSRAFATLSAADQRAFIAATAEAGERIDQVSRQQEDALLHGGFQHQGLRVATFSDSLRAELFEAARQAREREAEHFVPKPLLERARSLLNEYRAGRR